jgi:hypothetical protein
MSISAYAQHSAQPLIDTSGNCRPANPIQEERERETRLLIEATTFCLQRIHEKRPKMSRTGFDGDKMSIFVQGMTFTNVRYEVHGDTIDS